MEHNKQVSVVPNSITNIIDNIIITNILITNSITNISTNIIIITNIVRIIIIWIISSNIIFKVLTNQEHAMKEYLRRQQVK